jgi:hypothetical protein
MQARAEFGSPEQVVRSLLEQFPLERWEGGKRPSAR